MEYSSEVEGSKLKFLDLKMDIPHPEGSKIGSFYPISAKWQQAKAKFTYDTQEEAVNGCNRACWPRIEECCMDSFGTNLYMVREH